MLSFAPFCLLDVRMSGKVSDYLLKLQIKVQNALPIYTHMFNKINLYGRGVFYIILWNYAFATETAAAKADRHSKQLQQLPEGKLICTRCGNRTKWYRSNGHTKTYIPKDQKPYASQLAIRRYLLEKQKEYQTNLDALAYIFPSWQL